jgi:uracil-DNA glycosylase family 4
MAENAEAMQALRGYVHSLRERDGVRDVKLTRAAREGLAKLNGSVGSRTTGGGSPSLHGAVVDDRRTSFDPVARSATATTDGGHRPPLQLQTTAQRAAATAVTDVPRIDISGSTKAEQLAHLNERAQACVKCPHLVARRHTVVFGVGDPEAKLLFVGEGPGEDEDLKGEPFVGRAGQLLTKMIQAMGLAREQVYIANVLKCRPDMPPGAPGNRKPTKQEMETCAPYLRAQIEVIKPLAMVALGATAIEGLIGPVGSIGSLRGKFLEYRGVPLMPTYHPSYLLRNQSNAEKRKVWEDLLKVMEKLAMPITEKQRGFFLAK